MASVSLLGAAGSVVVVIPTTSSALSASTQTALNAISARVAAGTDTVLAYSGNTALPVLVRPTVLNIADASTLSVPAASVVDAIVNTSTQPVSIVDNTPTAVTIVSGAGGLTLDRSGSGAGSALILATGGTNQINLGSGAATVGVEGVATVNALGGTASVMSGSAAFAYLEVGGADTVDVSGTATVAFGAAAAAQVTVQDQANVVFSNLGGVATPVVRMASGTEILGTMAGSTATVSASMGGMMLVSNWGGRTFIDPGAANVTVFAGSGSETLFAAGDASMPGVALPAGMTLANTGSDFVFGGTGYFHGGSGPLNLLMSATVAGAATLVGGGAIDLLFSQGAGDSMRGAAGTVIINAAGFSEPGFSVAGAAAGNVLDAGASNAFMFGSAWGANTIVSGSGAATVFGNHGATGKVGNVYVDGGGAALGTKASSLTILDFLAGADVVSLRGDTIASTSTVTVAQAATSGTPGTYAVLGDGTTIGFIDQFLSSSQITAAFR